MPMETIMSEQSSVDSGQSDDEKTLADAGFYWRESGLVKVLVCRDLENAGFVNGFSTRCGGVSPFPNDDMNLAGYDEDSRENIEENRRRFLAAIGGEWQIATAWQVHGDNIRRIESDLDAGNSDERADALVSDAQGVLTGVKTADCVPILIGDPVSGAFGAVHAGWRGTVRSIAAKTLMILQEVYGSDPQDLICAIGPAACGRNYEVGQEVIDGFKDNFKNSHKYFSPTRDGHALVDLHLANYDQLRQAGVAAGNIYTAPYCTMERPDLFFSYRLEKQKYGRTGRLLSVIGRPNERLPAR
jgi:YfiH family protein